MARPIRLDAFLVRNHLATSKESARELISAGEVVVDGLVALKPNRQIRAAQKVNLKKTREWVGRGAFKLLGALADFRFDPRSLCCADLGASTGGFTQVLLKQGASRVYAVDVGRALLHRSIQTDERVIVMDGVNARHLQQLPEPIDLIVGDLSFISLQHILPTVRALLRPGGHAIVLIKPQFEVASHQIASGGVVRSSDARADAIAKIKGYAISEGFTLLGAHDCRLPGARAKNIEHFIHLLLAAPSPGGHSVSASEPTSSD